MLPKYGSPRLKFPKGEQKKFFEKIFQTSRLSAEELAKIVKVSPRTIRDWRREKFYPTKAAVRMLCKKLCISIPQNEDILVKNWVKRKLKISKMGGILYYQKYGLGTPEGRKKGGQNAMKILRKKGLMNPPNKFRRPSYSSKLAEFVGIILGDGSITRWGQVHITLNLKDDAEYSKFVSLLGKSLFGVLPKTIFRRSENVSITYYTGTKLVEYLIKIGLRIGNKVKNQVGVPKWISKNDEYSTACLKGLVDTDGCITNHSYLVNRKRYSYRKLVFANRSIPIIKFVHGHLNKLGLGAKIADKLETKYVWLYNNRHTKNYLDIVGTHNPRISIQGG